MKNICEECYGLDDLMADCENCGGCGTEMIEHFEERDNGYREAILECPKCD